MSIYAGPRIPVRTIQSIIGGNMDIYQILKQDHEKVKGMFKQVTGDSSSQSKSSIFSQIKTELTAHQEAEEKVFYSELEKGSGEIHDKTLEGEEEHHVANMVIKELAGMSSSDEHWKAKISVLQELVHHHIDEEEKTLFKLSKQLLNEGRANEIGQLFEKEKQKHMKAGHA
jgi:hemerythrin superfamily protein